MRRYALVNLLAMPGLGSLAMGRKSGWAQMVLALVATIITLVGFTAWIHASVEARQVLLDGGPRRMWVLVGFGLFAVSWLWTLGTTLSFLYAGNPRQGI